MRLPRGGDDQGVELAELQHQPAAVGGELLALGDRRPQPVEVVGGAPLGGEAGGRALDGDPRFEHVGERGAVVLEEEAGVAGDHRRTRGVHAGAAAGTAPDGDQLFGFEHAERLAKRRPGHAELLGERRLGRERLTLAQLAADDLLAQSVGDQLGRLRYPSRGRRRRGMRCRLARILTTVEADRRECVQTAAGSTGDDAERRSVPSRGARPVRRHPRAVPRRRSPRSSSGRWCRIAIAGRRRESSTGRCSRRPGANGFLGIDVPEEYGGGGVADFRFNVVIAEELQRADVNAAGLGITLHNDICLPYFIHQTNDEQKRRWLPGSVPAS